MTDTRLPVTVLPADIFASVQAVCRELVARI